MWGRENFGRSAVAAHLEFRHFVAVRAAEVFAEQGAEGDGEFVAAAEAEGPFVFVAGFYAKNGSQAERAVGAGGNDDLKEGDENRDRQQDEGAGGYLFILENQTVDQSTHREGHQRAAGADQQGCDAQPADGGRGLEAVHEGVTTSSGAA